MSGETFSSQADAQRTPQTEVRRWLYEIQLAKKREEEWRKRAQQVIDKYRGKGRRRNSFNILYANTDILSEAIYNSLPKPDVRRRFRQSDKLGKAASELLERGLMFSVDCDEFDTNVKYDVMDVLLPGRGVSRVRYIPSIKQVAPTAEMAEDAGIEGAEAQHEAVEPTHEEEAFEGSAEELDYEQVLIEHVQWDDFLHGAGKTWDEVCWVAFHHTPTKDDATKQFGEEIAKKLSYQSIDVSSMSDEDKKNGLSEVFQRADMWEIWDKDSGRVFFVSTGYKDGLIFPLEKPNGEPPLEFKGFFPCPRPLRLISDPSTLIPATLFDTYAEQANELDRVSTRINKITEGLKLRAIYDPTIGELNSLMGKDDNEMVPAAESARQLLATPGGLEKAILWMPIQVAAQVLKILVEAREQCKATIYELTGLADIIRGATNPNETLGAQQIKANFASLRLQKMRREVQRYVRDLLRLMSEVIGDKFEQETLAQMSGMQFLTDAEMQVKQAEAAALSAQQQPIPQDLQNILMGPTWEQVMGVMRSDLQREYRVEVETDSTVQESVTSDMAALKEVLTGLVQFWQGAGPAVMQGALSIEAVKAISLVICRRAKLGLEVEDALEQGFSQPKPQTPQVDPAKQQAENARSQADVQVAQSNAQSAQARAGADVARAQADVIQAHAQIAASVNPMAQPNVLPMVQR